MSVCHLNNDIGTGWENLSIWLLGLRVLVVIREDLRDGGIR